MVKSKIKVGEYYAVDPRDYVSRSDNQFLHAKKAKVIEVGRSRKVYSDWSHHIKDDGILVEFVEPVEKMGKKVQRKVVTSRKIYAPWDKEYEDAKWKAEYERDTRAAQVKSEVAERDRVIDQLSGYGVHAQRTWNNRNELLISVVDLDKLVKALARARADAV